MKFLQAVIVRRDGKWYASAVQQSGVVREASGETISEALDVALSDSAATEQCPACAGDGYAFMICGDEEKRSACETCGGAKVIDDALALELVEAGWEIPFATGQADACDARANILIQAARELRRRARKLSATKSPLDPITFADVVRAVTP